MERTGRRRRGRWLAMLVVLVLAAFYCAWAVRRPLPELPAAVASATTLAAVPAGKPLSWPAGGQAAVGIAGSPITQTHGKQAGKPTASTAKLITVLSVLRKHPLTPGQPGPTITLTAKDVALFNYYNSREGSVVPVKAGEKITEYQMLEAILLPSANNMADSLAVWAFGSLPNYSNYANGYVKDLGLTATHVGSDASGFDPGTVSSARDLLKLGEMAMENPVLSRIVGQPKAHGIPIAGTVKNVNSLLGTNGIVGIKTGNTDQAGGVFVAADRGVLNAKQVTLVTAVLGSPTLFSAMQDSLSLIQSVQANFQPVTVVKAGAVVGRYDLPWGGSVLAVAGGDLRLRGWGGTNIPFTATLKPISQNSKAGQAVGTITVKKSALYDQKSVQVNLLTTPAPPSIRWRLLHPLN